MTEFELLLQEHLSVLKRFVHYKVNNFSDAEDIIQEEIAKKLLVPLGTVKSRLHYAKEKFKSQYPYPPKEKEETVRRNNMIGNVKKIPDYLPEYTIEKSDKEPFSVKWEELMGWFLVPKLGESLSWGMYDMPSRKLDYRYDMKVTGRAIVHGIEGVEIDVEETDGNGKKGGNIERSFVAQLTDTHCRCLAALREQNGLKQYITFLDGDAFMPNWGFGEDNCGNETNLSPKGDIKRTGNEVVSADKDFLLDIVGRYNVTINGKTYDTVCVMDIETYNTRVVSEQFLDKNGKTVLWRRFNRNDWAIERYGKLWTELLPENDRLVINGQTYVEWYDCITDHVL